VSDLPETAREGYLRAHVERQYDVHVVELRRLDRGVFDVHLQDGRRWVVRVFPERRPVGHVEGDAEILRFLEGHGFPAERCAEENPVSILYGRGILVTEYVEGVTADASESTLEAFGEMLGRLNLLPAEDGALAHEAGALHHYPQGGGGPETELAAAASWLAALEEQVPATSRALYESLRERVASADDCHGLPLALVHPDPVLKNLIVTNGNNLVLIDWSGAGRGPRIAALAVLIWSGALAKGGWSPSRVDAIVAGYRSHMRLEEDELARLPGAMRIRPLVFACWRYRHAIHSGRVPDGTEWWWPNDDLVRSIAARASAAFRR
jgi:Ser/Thr protein kinase RdoA (MazF antagonist)